MRNGEFICNWCPNRNGCDTNLTPQFVSRHCFIARVSPTDDSHSFPDCRHFTCASGGLNGATQAISDGQFKLINTTEGSVEAVTFESDDKRTKGLRWVAKDGTIYSCQNKGGKFYRTGQKIDGYNVVTY